MQKVKYRVPVKVMTHMSGIFILPDDYQTEDLIDAIEAAIKDEGEVTFGDDEFEIDEPTIIYTRTAHKEELR